MNAVSIVPSQLMTGVLSRYMPSRRACAAPSSKIPTAPTPTIHRQVTRNPARSLPR